MFSARVALLGASRWRSACYWQRVQDSALPVLSMWALHAGFLVSRAREFCAAAQFDLRTAMRPFGSLSGGEQARAQVARLLDEGVQRSRLDVQSIARGFIQGFVR